MRVALTRSSEATAASAARLAAMGFATAVIPVVTIRATGATPPIEPFDALVATSAAAFSGLAPGVRERLAPLRLYVVGDRTAKAAAQAGFTSACVVAPDAAALAARLVDLLPKPSSALYLAGRDRMSGLEDALIAAGHRVTVCEVYEAQARADWSEDEAQALAACDAVLHYSRRSAELAAGLAERAGLAAHFSNVLHVCISDTAAEPLRFAGAHRIFIASSAREENLFETLAACAKTN